MEFSDAEKDAVDSTSPTELKRKREPSTTSTQIPNTKPCPSLKNIACWVDYAYKTLKHEEVIFYLIDIVFCSKISLGCFIYLNAYYYFSGVD